MSEPKPDTTGGGGRLERIARLGVERVAGEGEIVVSGVQFAWRRLIRVGEGVTGDDSRVRQGELLNTLLVAATLVALGVLAILEVARQRGYLHSRVQTVSVMLFPLAIVLLGFLSFWLCKRGRIALATHIYIWVTLLAVIGAAGIVNGYRSATWLLVAWPVVLAGSLLSPFAGLGVGIGALIAYGAFALVEAAGWYMPLMPTPLESFPFLALSFGWLMIIVAVGLINAINGASLGGTVKQLSAMSRELDASRQELTLRVAERTSALQSRAEQFRTIAELGQAATSMAGLTSGDSDVFLSRAVGLISERLGFDHVGIFLLDRDGEWAVLRAASSAGGQRMVLRGHRLRIGQQGIVGYVAERGVARYALNVDEDVTWVDNPELPDTKSEIALPLVIAGRVIGVLDMQTRRPAAFGEAELEIFRVLADSVAVAIENGRLFQETQEAMARLQRYQSEDAIAGWRQALARRHSQVGFRYVFGETEPADLLVSPSGNGDGDAELARVGAEAEVAVDETLALAAGSRLGGMDLSMGQGVVRVRGDNGEYVLLAPVGVGGRQLGALTFERNSPWSDESVRLVTSVLNQLDLALANARLLEETRLRARQEAARSEIVGRIRAMTSTDAILRNAAEELGRALQVERSRIQLRRFTDDTSLEG
jgi:GAF domain-containing protein